MGVRENLERWREDYAREQRAVGRTEGRNDGRQEGRAEGRQEGRAEGRQEGRAAGQRSLLEKLSRLRFGALSAGDAERLSRADAAQLELWAGRVLTARSLAEVWR